jgi:hypothetical protein
MTFNIFCNMYLLWENIECLQIQSIPSETLFKGPTVEIFSMKAPIEKATYSMNPKTYT